MKKDLSSESIKAVKDAAERVLAQYGKEPHNAAHIEYKEGELAFFRHSNEVWITYKGNEVFHFYPPHTAKDVHTFYPDDWIDEVERISIRL